MVASGLCGVKLNVNLLRYLIPNKLSSFIVCSKACSLWTKTLAKILERYLFYSYSDTAANESSY